MKLPKFSPYSPKEKCGVLVYVCYCFREFPRSGKEACDAIETTTCSEKNLKSVLDEFYVNEADRIKNEVCKWANGELGRLRDDFICDLKAQKEENANRLNADREEIEEKKSEIERLIECVETLKKKFKEGI